MDAEDLAAFFDPADGFATSVTVRRSGVTVAEFGAIPGLQDREALDDRVMATLRQIAYATGPDIRTGDTVILSGFGPLASFNGTYRAREPMAANDGLESRCTLTLIQPAA